MYLIRGRAKVTYECKVIILDIHFSLASVSTVERK